MSQRPAIELTGEAPVGDAPMPEHRHGEPAGGRSALAWLSIWITLISLSAFIASLLLIFANARQGFFVPTLAALFSIVAALFDARSHRIPNPLTYTAILLGFGLSILGYLFDQLQLAAAMKWLAAPEISQSLLGFGALVLVVLVTSIFGYVGGGDKKFFAALGALLGLYDVANAFIFGLTIALVIALLNLALSNRINQVLRTISIQLLELVYLRRVSTMHEDEPLKADGRFPMAIPIALGIVISQLFNLDTLLEKV